MGMGPVSDPNGLYKWLGNFGVLGRFSEGLRNSLIFRASTSGGLEEDDLDDLSQVGSTEGCLMNSFFPSTLRWYWL